MRTTLLAGFARKEDVFPSFRITNMQIEGSMTESNRIISAIYSVVFVCHSIAILY